MISGMKKLTLAAAKSDMDRITRELIWLSAVEVSPASEQQSALEKEGVVRCDVSAQITGLERQSVLLSEAIDTLAVFGSGKKKQKNSPGLLDRKQLEGLSEQLPEALSCAEKVRELTREVGTRRGEINRREAELVNLSPWVGLDIPLGTQGTKRTALLKGTLPLSLPLQELCEPLSAMEGAVIGKVSQDKAVQYVYVLCLTEKREDVLSFLAAKGFSAVCLEKYAEPAAAETVRLQREMQTLRREKEETEQELRRLGKRRRELENAYDYTQAELSRLRVEKELLCTDSAWVMQGWIPEKALPRLCQKLKDIPCCYEVRDPEEGEEVPVLLSNGRLTSPFESIIGSYGYPKYGSFDPTWIVSIFYALIFGLIMQDVGYGLLLVVFCPLLIKKMRPKKSTRQLLQVFTICGVSTMLCGVLFGGYFSDFPHELAVNFFGASPDTLSNVALLFNPIENNMGFLIMTLGVGAVHMVIGMLIRAYMLARRGNWFAAVFDVGSWLVVFAGLGLLFAVPAVGKWVAIAGVLMLVLTQGRHSKSLIGKLFGGIYSLYDIISYLSDLLSYSRIFALGLSGAIIGQVMNILGTLAGGSFVGFLALIAIFVLGHGLNLALSLISSYVHTARLQYIEFFGKFYEEGGRPFEPAAINTKYSDITEEVKTV